VKCGAVTASGAPCKRDALPGTEPPRCVSHTGVNGRKSKLTRDVEARVVAIIAAGNHLEVAAAAGGIGLRTLHDWMARGNPAGTARRDAPYRRFRAAVERAQAEGEATLVTRIQKAAANGSWQAAAWLLERRYPERYTKPKVAPDELPSRAPAPSTPAERAEAEFAALDELAARRDRSTA
jgi:transposase